MVPTRRATTKCDTNHIEEQVAQREEHHERAPRDKNIHLYWRSLVDPCCVPRVNAQLCITISMGSVSSGKWSSAGASHPFLPFFAQNTHHSQVGLESLVRCFKALPKQFLVPTSQRSCSESSAPPAESQTYRTHRAKMTHAVVHCTSCKLPSWAP